MHACVHAQTTLHDVLELLITPETISPRLLLSALLVMSFNLPVHMYRRSAPRKVPTAHEIVACRQLGAISERRR